MQHLPHRSLKTDRENGQHTVLPIVFMGTSFILSQFRASPPAPLQGERGVICVVILWAYKNVGL